MAPKVIAFWVPKGGVGKTTRCMEMGFELADLGKRVVILEFDSQKDISKRLFRRDDVQAYSGIEMMEQPA